MAFDYNEAEQAVVGSILIDPRVLPDVTAELRPADFGFEINRAIYQAAIDLNSRGVSIDPVLILEETRRAGNEVPREYLLQLMDVTPTAANVKEYLPIVREQALRRGVLALATQIQSRANSGEAPAQLLADLQTQGNALAQEGTDRALLGPFDLAMRWMDHRLRLEEGKSAAFVPTGYRDLDYILGGGLIASGMHVLAARPGMGKTTFALNIADRVAKNVGPVLFVSLEMDDEQITAKRISRESGIPGNKLLMDANLPDEQARRMADASDRLTLLPLYVNAKPSATVAEIAAWARQVPELKLIVIDYLGKISRSKDQSKASLYESITQISADVKTLARTFKIPVLVLSQINRESEKRNNKRPNLADLRDTGAIEQDADTVTFLYRPEYYGDPLTRDPYQPEETECIVAKNRHAGTGECKLAMCAAVSKFVTVNADPRAGVRMAMKTGNL